VTDWVQITDIWHS